MVSTSSDMSHDSRHNLTEYEMKNIGVATFMAVLGIAFSASAQTVPPPTAPAPQQQVSPAPSPAPQAAPQQATAKVECTKLDNLKPTDGGFKEVKVHRQPSGGSIAVGDSASVIVPTSVGLMFIDAGPAQSRKILAVTRCTNGANIDELQIEARITAVTPKYEEITILVPSTVKDFPVRSCSFQTKQCARRGEFKAGAFDKPVELGAWFQPRS